MKNLVVWYDVFEFIVVEIVFSRVILTSLIKHDLDSWKTQYSRFVRVLNIIQK